MAVTLGKTYFRSSTSAPWVFLSTNTTGDPYPTSGRNYSTTNRRHHDGSYRTGGNWHMYRITTYLPLHRMVLVGSTRMYAGEMRISPPQHMSQWLTSCYGSTGGVSWESTQGIPSAYAASLEALGSTMYNRIRPDKPSFDVALQLLELKDVPKTLKQSLETGLKVLNSFKVIKKTRGRSLYRHPTKKGKLIGEYTLMTLFGYLPMVSAVSDFMASHDALDQNFQRVLRRASRPTRRMSSKDVTIQTFNDTAILTAASQLAPALPTQIAPTGQSYRSAVFTTETWAEGRFRMTLPKGPDGLPDRRRIMRRLMGSRLTLSTAYNLMPWSWLADYFTDLGQFFQAISPGVADLVTSDYFYIMRSVSYEETLTSVAKFPDGQTLTISKTTQRVAKTRRSATRFGFGVTTSSLNQRQLAVLGALGLSKL